VRSNLGSATDGQRLSAESFDLQALSDGESPMPRTSTRLREETPNLPNDHLIQDMIASLGMNNDEILAILYRREQNVDCIIDGAVLHPETGKPMSRADALELLDLDEPSDEDRVAYCERQVQTSSNKAKAKQTWGSFHRGGKMVKSKFDAYLKLRNQRLKEQVRRARKQEQYRREKADAAGSRTEGFGGGGSVHDIQERAVSRISTGVPTLDEIFGSNMGEETCGIPIGTTTLLGGEYGVGKTRTLVWLSAVMSRPEGEADGQGHRVLYQQGEMPPDIFKTNYIRAVLEGSEDMFVYGDLSLGAQIDRMYEVMPKLVIVDSYQMIAETSNQRGAQRVIDRMAEVGAEIGCAVIFISHLNAAGEIKGGTNIPHMVDIVMTAKKMVNPQEFMISCPKKNRFGPTGRSAMFAHGESKIIPFTPGSRTLTTGKRSLATIQRPNLDQPRRPATVGGRGAAIDVPRIDAQTPVDEE